VFRAVHRPGAANSNVIVTDEGLKAIASYLKKELPKDPWGNNYVYTSPGEHGDYDLVSFGADSVEGGEDINRDIVSWK